MSIKSSPFSSTILTGKDAQQFIWQFNYAAPNPKAIESVKRGIKLAREFQKNKKIVFNASS